MSLNASLGMHTALEDLKSDDVSRWLNQAVLHHLEKSFQH